MAEQLPYRPRLRSHRQGPRQNQDRSDARPVYARLSGNWLRHDRRIGAIIALVSEASWLPRQGRRPTELYKRFRNPSQTGAAAAEALRTGYRVLYEMNENAHQLPEKDLKGLLVQATGLEPESST